MTSEYAIGSHLVNSSLDSNYDVYYWREKNQEVDFVMRKGKNLVGIEVKSGRRRERTSGIESFSKHYKPQRILLIGEGGISVKDFLESEPESWLHY